MARDAGRDDGLMNAAARSVEERRWRAEVPGYMSDANDSNGAALSILPISVIRDLRVVNAVKPFMESAIRHGIEGYDPDYYMDLCAYGKAHLWVGLIGSTVKGIMITMKVEYPQFSALRVLMCAGLPGSLETFGSMAWSALVQWAQHLGASKIEAWGRSGWERALQDYARPEKKVEVLSYGVPEA